MNSAGIKDPERSDRFLRMVDFKWLMAGMGWWVDLTRLRTEAAYFDQCLQRALTSDSELLRSRSVELLGSQCGRRTDLDGPLPRSSAMRFEGEDECLSST
jgi:hypothetical protein